MKRQTQHYGMCAQERTVISLYDRGYGRDDIVRQSGISLKRVESIISMLHGGADLSEKAFFQSVRAGSMALAARIVAVHGPK